MSIHNVSVSQRVGAFAYISLLLLAGHGLYIWLTAKHLAVVGTALSSAFFYLPDDVIVGVDKGDALSIFYAVAIMGGHIFAYAAAATALGALAARWFQRREPAAAVAGPDAREHMAIKAPAIKLAVARVVPGEDGQPSQLLDTRVGPQSYLHLKRSLVEFSRPAQSPVEELEQALWSVLYAYRDWPADPAGHHADTDLLTHSRAVAERMRAETKGHPLATVLGLAHDLGKIIAYRPKEKVTESGTHTVWTIASKRHDHHSAHLLRMLPEYQALPEKTKNTLNAVMSFSHHPEALPKNSTGRQELELLNALRKADGLATAADQRRTEDLASQPDVVEAVQKALASLLPRLNINAVSGGYADGWTLSLKDYVAVRETALREKLADYLTPDLVQALSLRVDRTKHPATGVLYAALDGMGLLIHTHSGKQPEMGLFDARVGQVDFYRLFLLRREKLAEMGELLEEWGECEFKIKLLNPRAVVDDDQT